MLVGGAAALSIVHAPPTPGPVGSGIAQISGTGVTPSDFFGGPTLLSGKITADGNLVILIIPQFSGDVAIADGSLLFGDEVDVYFYNLHNSQESVYMNAYEGVNGTGQGGRQEISQNFIANPFAATEVIVHLFSHLQQTNVNMSVDGVSWVFQHLTPLSFIPFLSNVGGIDLLVITILLETVVLIAPLILLGRFLTHKAIHAPKFSLLLWGHVVIISILVIFFADYRWLDQTFGGVSYLVYPVVIAVMMFMWSLSLFNRSYVVEILKPDTMSGHRLRYLRWTQLVGETKDGRTVICDPRWRGFAYALKGHFATLIPVESEATVEGAPAGAEVENRETMAAHELRKQEKKLRRLRPGKGKPEDDFKIVNAEDAHEPTKIFWVDSNQPVAVEFPHLSWHKMVDVPEKIDKHGTTVPAHTEPKLTWPHIVDGESTIRLAGIHYWDAPLAALGWSRAEDDFALLEKRAYAVYVLRSRVHSEADRLTEERVAEMLTMMERGEIPMTEEEAWSATERRNPRGVERDRDDLSPLERERLREDVKRRYRNG